MWKRSFRARLPPKCESWRCENEAFVRDLPQKVKVKDVKTKLSCETSFKKSESWRWWKWSFRARLLPKCESGRKMRKRSFRARPPSKCEKLKMRKRSFRARLPAKSESGRCENDAFVQDFLQILKVQVVKVKLELSVPLRGWSENDPGLNETCSETVRGTRFPINLLKHVFVLQKHSISFIRQLSKTDFVRDFPQQVKVEDVKAKLSCETPSKSESGRCENEAFARGVPHKVKVEDVKTKLSCKTSLKKWKWKMWKRRFRARRPSDIESSSGESEAWTVSSTAGLIWEWSRSKQTCSETVRGTRFPINLLKHVLSCKTQHFVHPPTLKNRFRARLPSTSESWRCESEAFVRDSLQNLKVEDAKTKLSCEASLTKWKLKMWKRSFRARLPSKSASGICENEAFVRDFPQNVKVEDVRTKLSCETSLKKWKLKMWKRSFRADFFSKLIHSIQFISIQFNSTQVNSIQFNSTKFNSTQFKSVSIQIQLNPSQLKSIQVNSIKFNSI